MPTISPPSYRDIAEFAAASLYFGLLSPCAVVGWADRVVVTNSPVPAWAAELSLASADQSRTIVELLEAVPGQTTGETPLQLLLGLLYREWHRGRLNWRVVQGIAG